MGFFKGKYGINLAKRGYLRSIYKCMRFLLWINHFVISGKL